MGRALGVVLHQGGLALCAAPDVAHDVVEGELNERPAPQKLKCYICVELVAVGATVGCDSVSSR